MFKSISLGALIIFSLSSLLCFAEDNRMFYPSSNQQFSDENFKLQSMINDTASQIKKSSNFDFIYACQAVRENNLSLCSQATDSRQCMEEAKEIMEIRRVAERNCKGLKIFPSSLCRACSKENCSSLSGEEKGACEAILSRDAESLYKNGKNILSLGDYADAEEMLNFYYGFKYYSEMACDRFKSPLQGGSYKNKMACKVLFGSGDSHKIIDRIVLDLAYFQYVKSVKNDVGICENIKDSTIKEACKSPKIKEFGSFFTSRP